MSARPSPSKSPTRTSRHAAASFQVAHREVVKLVPVERDTLYNVVQHATPN